MKRYDTGGGWSTESAHGKWVLYEDSRELVAVLQVAHEMEVKNLKAEIDALKAELAALKAPPKVLSAEEVTEPGWYWHTRKGWGGDWFIHKVVRYGVLDELHTLGNCFSYDRLDGQFVGPLKAPEV